METWQAITLGVIEGLTEFIPVSSTGHLVLAGHFLNVHSPARAFEILIQLGALLAILSVYAAKLLRIITSVQNDAAARRFIVVVLLAFLPAVLVGALLHSSIKGLLEQPALVCQTLIIGGLILLIVDRMQLKPVVHDVMQITPATAIKIGICQCLAMIPGVSRSGATIVGAMMFGADKRTAAEFSFFLAMPTMVGAFAYDLFKSYDQLDTAAVQAIVIGFVVSFVTGVFVVKGLLDFVSRYGFALFAWWRIAVGGVGLAALAWAG